MLPDVPVVFPRRSRTRLWAMLLAAVLLPTSARADGETAVVLPATGPGVDPAVLQLLTSALRERVSGRGYRLVDPPGAIVPGTAPLDAARSAARTAQVTVAVAARITIPAAGRYQLSLFSASGTSNQTWSAQDQSPSAGMVALLDRLLATAVPAPGETGAVAAPPPIVSPAPPPPILPPAPPPPVVSPTPLPPVVPTTPLPPVVSNAAPGDGLPPVISNAPAQLPLMSPQADARMDLGEAEQYDTLRVVRVRQRRVPKLMIGAMTESCIGVNRNFYNHLIGPRIQFAFSQSFFGFATVAYAYYQDDPGFGLVAHAGIEGRVRLGRTGKTGLPFRFSLGFAPENGGFLKLDMGLAIAVGKRTDLVLIPLAPTIWFLEGGNAVSMNFAVEVNTAL
jgi:hypothetical protein